MIAWINLIVTIALWGSLICICLVSSKKDNVTPFLVNYTSYGRRKRMIVYVRMRNQKTAALMLRNWLKTNYYRDAEIIFAATPDVVNVLDEYELDDD